MSRPTWDDYFMRYAYLAATRATCPRKHVGAVIVDPEHRVVSTGYNGAPSDVEQCDTVGCQIVNGHCVRTLHAESNALDYAGTWRTRDCTLYVTITPCWDCAKRIVGGNFKRVVYGEHYESRYGKSTDVPHYLGENGIVVDRYPLEFIERIKQGIAFFDMPTDIAAVTPPGGVQIPPAACAVHRFANDVCVVCGTRDD